MFKALKGCATLVFIVFAGIIMLAMLGVQEVSRNNRISKLEATLQLEGDKEPAHPLVVTIQNNSEDSVTSSTWRIAAFTKNQSAPLLRSNIYSSDFIIPGGGTRRFHCDVPEAKPEVDVVNQPLGEYRWKVELIDAQYADEDMPASVDDEVVRVEHAGQRPLVRQAAGDGVAIKAEPRLVGWKSLQIDIQSAGWVKKKGPSFLARLLTDESDRKKNHTRDFHIELALTNTSPVRLNITGALKFQLHGGAENKHLGTINFDDDNYVIMEPVASKIFSLTYKVDKWDWGEQYVYDWSLRLAGDAHFLVLKGPDKKRSNLRKLSVTERSKCGA